MVVSIVIATYNRKCVLERTLPSLLQQHFPPSDFEIIVVVDGSTDGTVEMLRTYAPQCAFRILEQENRGSAAARNAGLAVALGNLILFLDDDIRCEPNLVEQHVSAHADLKREPLVVHGPIFVAPESPVTLATSLASAAADRLHNLLMPGAQLEMPQYADLICNSSIPRNLLLASGGFDTSMPFQRDDCELGIRLWKMGAQFRYQASAIAYEIFVKSSRQFAVDDAAQCGKGEVLLCRKHPEYRPYSALATVGYSRFGRRLLRKFALGIFPFERLMTAPIRLAERLQWISLIRLAGIRLLAVQRRLVFLRSAVREIGSYKALQRTYGVQLPVLLYHNIAAASATTDPSLTISPTRFERQIRWLAKMGYSSILPSDWLVWCRTGQGLPKKPVLLTFDDAYAAMAEYALPVLQKHGFGAAVFVVTKRIGGRNSWETQIGRTGTDRLMAAVQIKEWGGKGIEFGAHSRTHPDLTKLPEQQLADEIDGSLQELEAVVGTRIISFAYPYGLYDNSVTERTRSRFNLAFSCDEGVNWLQTDTCLLRRNLVRPGDLLIDFACRVRFGRIPLAKIRSRLRVRSRAKRFVATLTGKA
jgi:glycosyltransferase involved in cell wall biosynthesis/peptidoglycan/xylan/chitin deacetylase (PgdA/CDA1 family)